MLLTEYLRKCIDLDSPPMRSTLCRTTAVGCVHINKELVFEDFPQLRALVHGEGLQLEDWFERTFGFVSLAQCENSGSFFTIPNTESCIDDRHIGFRQDHMGRACITEVDILGEKHAIELKGCGTHDDRLPIDSLHGNGFQNLIASINDYSYSLLLNRHVSETGANSKWRPTKIYALMRYDFDCSHDGKRYPCAFIVREPTPRNEGEPWPSYDSVETAISAEIEEQLRRYGITSVLGDPFELRDGVISDSRCRTIWTTRHDSEEINKDISWICEGLGIGYPFRSQVVNVQLFWDDEQDKYVLVDMEHFKPVSIAPGGDIMVPCGDKTLGIGRLSKEPPPSDSHSQARFAPFLQLFEKIFSDVALHEDFAWPDRSGDQRQIYKIWDDVFGILEQTEDFSEQTSRLKTYLDAVFAECEKRSLIKSEPT